MPRPKDIKAFPPPPIFHPMYLFFVLGFCRLIQSHFHALDYCMFEAFSSAGSELCTVSMWTFFKDATVTLKLLLSTVWILSLSSSAQTAHLHTHICFSTPATFPKRPIHRRFRRRSCNGLVANNDCKRVEFPVNDVKKRSQENTSINEN